MMLLAKWVIENQSDFGTACLFSLLCVIIVFAVLILITLVLSLLNHIKALDVKEKVVMKDGTEVDDDMMAAILVATIDYRKEHKEDCKVISCKLVEQDEKKGK